MRKKPYEKYKKWLNENTSSLSDKVVAITGSTGGLGRELVRYIAYLGASLVLIDRNITRSETLRDEIRSEFKETEIKCVTADLSDFDSVKAAAKKLLELDIDILIHNAGAYSIPRKVCETGYDNVFQINFVSPYYLTRTLMKGICERGGRVVIVGSIAHNYSKTDPSDIDFKTRKKASLVYGNAKRFLMYSSFGLFRDGREKHLSITHPGITFTGITSHYPKLIFALIKHPMKIIFMRREKAALSILNGIFTATEEKSWLGPKLFNVWGLPSKKKLLSADDIEISFIEKTSNEIYENLK